MGDRFWSRNYESINMKKPSSGFLDLDLKPIIEYKTLNKDGKWEKKTRRRRKELQTLLELMRKEIGSPCPKLDVHCVVCQAWISWMIIDRLFED